VISNAVAQRVGDPERRIQFPMLQPLRGQGFCRRRRRKPALGVASGHTAGGGKLSHGDSAARSDWLELATLHKLCA
jgi:hypothetical protein